MLVCFIRSHLASAIYLLQMSRRIVVCLCVPIGHDHRTTPTISLITTLSPAKTAQLMEVQCGPNHALDGVHCGASGECDGSMYTGWAKQ